MPCAVSLPLFRHQVDMWAVGAIFAEMLGLGVLFAGENDIDQLAKVREAAAGPFCEYAGHDRGGGEDMEV